MDIFYDAEGKRLYLADDSGVRALSPAAVPESVPAVAGSEKSPKPRKQYKYKRGPHKTEKSLADEADQLHGRSKIDPAVKHEIENRLLAGETVASILEKIEVSAPTIYVIKTRLKQEGRLR